MLRRLHRLVMRGRSTYPWWLAYAFDNPLRRLVHRRRAMLGGFVSEGDTVIDLGCGMGYFTIDLADLVGPAGRVIAVDVQQQMLERTRRRAARAGVLDRVEFVRATREQLGVTRRADFVLAFWMFHEVAQPRAVLEQLRALLKPTGRLLLAEPLGHVSPAFFDRSVALVRDVGFDIIGNPPIRLSRSILCAPRADAVHCASLTPTGAVP